MAFCHVMFSHQIVDVLGAGESILGFWFMYYLEALLSSFLCLEYFVDVFKYLTYDFKSKLKL